MVFKTRNAKILTRILQTTVLPQPQERLSPPNLPNSPSIISASNYPSEISLQGPLARSVPACVRGLWGPLRLGCRCRRSCAMARSVCRLAAGDDLGRWCWLVEPHFEPHLTSALISTIKTGFQVFDHFCGGLSVHS
jgi:hypothetical protein